MEYKLYFSDTKENLRTMYCILVQHSYINKYTISMGCSKDFLDTDFCFRHCHEHVRGDLVYSVDMSTEESPSQACL
jgi:hypothetical protein